MKRIFVKIASSAMALIALAALVSVSIFATTQEQNTYVVSQTSYTSDTATWNWLAFSGTTVDVANGDTSLGGVVYDTTNVSTYTKKIQIKKGYLDLYTPFEVSGDGAVLYVPVPAGSAGTITVKAQSGSSARYLYMNTNTAGAQAANTAGSSYTYTSSDIVTYASAGSYIKFTCYATDTGGTAQKEYKIGSIQTVLTTGAYEATATLYDVTYYSLDAPTVPIATESVASGEYAVLDVTAWGKDVIGYYSDAAGEIAMDRSTTAITEATSIYCEFQDWNYYEYNGGNYLDSNLIDRYASVYPGNATQTNFLTNTMFAVNTGCSAESSSGQSYISTGGTLTTTGRSLVINALCPGELSVFIGTGGTSAREARFASADGTLIPAASGTVTFDGSTYEPNHITYNIPAAGTYLLGGSNGMRIYEVEFYSLVEAVVQFSADGTDIRVVGLFPNDVDYSLVTGAGIKIHEVNGAPVDLTLECTTFYDGIAAIDTEFFEVLDEGLYAFAYTITNIPDGTVIKARVYVIIDGVTYYTNEGYLVIEAVV